MEIENTRALITGGTSGIGRELALALRDAGARVLVCGRDPRRVAAMEAEPGIRALCCDLAEPEELRALVTSVDAYLGELEILVHCAGVQRAFDLAAGAELAEMEHEIAVNLLAPLRLTHALLPRLLEAEQAAIVNVTSILATTPKPTAPVYCATKAGLASLTESLRVQLGPHGVQVMELVPPLVATAMTRGRDEGAIEPSVVARAAVDGLRRGAPVVRVGKARLVRVLQRWVPGLVARMMRRAT